MHRSPVFFTGSSHQELAKETCAELGISLSPIALGTFPDGEISVELLSNVQGQDVFVLQSLALNPNQHLMELLIIIDALKRASAKKITAIIPYLSYCRQDRRNKPGVPITAKLVANLLSCAGIHHLITFDLHSDQVEGFFEVPVTHLSCQELLSQRIKPLIGESSIVVAPDIGSIKIAERMAKKLHTNLATIKKERNCSFQVEMSLIGDVSGKNVVIADDLCSTGGTLVTAAKLCREMGAKDVIAAITHGLFVKQALEKIDSSVLTSVWITNTIPFTEKVSQSKKIQGISTAKMIAEAVKSLSS
jgi:ribose-phosphate pyrophosphokinase